MAAVRPVLTVYKLDGSKACQVKTPAVFDAPLRKDIVHFVHTSMAKNRRQPYAVKDNAGMGYSAESWGTGRAVARIPRISGGGTSRSGQGAFGNMCRGGRLWAPTKIWRRWHRKLSVNMKRYAVAAALAASATTSLVMARGHAIGTVPEIPFVLASEVESVSKTKEAIAILKKLGADADVLKARNSRKVTSGVSKLRGRTHTGRKGPLVVYSEDKGITRAFRNLPGVDLVKVTELNLLTLAPGGHLGRFIIWTQGAVEKLHSVFGSKTRASTQKSGYTLPYNVMTNSDIDRIINSTEIQSKLRAPKKNYKAVAKLNPLTNFRAKVALNPYALFARRAEVGKQLRAAAAKEAKLKAIREGKPVPRTPHEIKVRAQKLAAAKLSKLNAKRIIKGETPSAAETKAAQFNTAKYAKALKQTTVGPSPKRFDLAAYKVPAQVVKAQETAAAMKAAAAAKSLKRREYVAKTLKAKAAAKKAAAAKAKKAAPKKK